jgi:putative IMPACT (imprinted ancient) family translation regulator
LIRRTLSTRAFEFVESGVITDRKSRFQSFATRIANASDARAFADSVRVRGASHAMVAWKCGNTAGRDDDGETGAGERVLFLIDRLRMDNVAVCTLRWHGGPMLGADRFKHISNAAREALLKLK